MRKFENQILISPILKELLDFLEVNCSAACCGLQAFEINKSLLLRQIIDKGSEGVSWYNSLISDVGATSEEIDKISVIDPEQDIPVIYPENDSCPEFYLPYNELKHLFKRLKIIIEQVKGSNAVP